MKTNGDVIIQHDFYGRKETTKQAILTKSEKQFLLYTKGHFVKSDDLIEDIKIFTAKNYGLYKEHTDWSNVMHFMIQLFDGLIETGYIKTEGKTPTQYLLEEILEHDLKRDDNSLLRFIIGRLQFVNVHGLDLGEADSSYMPLKVKPKEAYL